MVKRRNSKTKLKPNFLIKYNPNKTVSVRLCVKERDFFR